MGQITAFFDEESFKCGYKRQNWHNYSMDTALPIKNVSQRKKSSCRPRRPFYFPPLSKYAFSMISPEKNIKAHIR